MAMKFQKVNYTTSGEFSFNYMSLVKDYLKGYTFKFTKKNLRNDSRLTIIAQKGNETPVTAVTSTALSKWLKPQIGKELTQREAMAFLVTRCWVIEGANQSGEARTLIAFPQGEAGEELESFSLNDLKVDEKKVKEMNW